jgi:hypothetical protein
LESINLYAKYCSAASWVVGASDYSWVVGARLGLHAEELSEQHQWGLIPKNASEKWTKTDTWKMPLEFKLRYSIL